MEIKIVVDLHVLGDFERVCYCFLERTSSFPSCLEKTKKLFLLKYFNYFRFYGESESRLRQVFAEASLWYVLLDNFYFYHLFAVLVPALMFLNICKNL